MKTTKTILALASALALLMAACVGPTLDPTSPNLDNFNDVRSNTDYTNNLTTGTSYFPTIATVSGSNLNATSSALNARLVKIDFSNAIAYAQGQSKTIGIIDDGEKLKAAVKFYGVTYGNGGTIYNDYTDLSYTVTRPEPDVFYAELTGLTVYNAVQPYINGSRYFISGKPVDTNNNGAPGEDPYDNYYQFAAIGITNGRTAGINTAPDFPTEAFSLTGGINKVSAGIEVGTGNYDYREADLAACILLEKWSGTSWEPSGITGRADVSRKYYFTIPTTGTIEKYRVVAVDLYKFESSPRGQFKHRFSSYPGSGGSVKKADGKKVLSEEWFVANTYWTTHDVGGNSSVLFQAPQVITDIYGKNAQVILNVDTSENYPLGAGASKDAIKLVYKTGSGNAEVYHFIPITNASFRVKPGTSSTASPLNQQLTLDLDPSYVWVNGQTIEVYANSLVKFGAVALGDEKGSTSVNFNGDNKWGLYGSFSSLTASTGGTDY
jgi:hypothetical protein